MGEVVPFHKLKRPRFAAFQFGGFFGRAKNRQIFLAKIVNDSGNQWRLRTNYRQPNFLFNGKFCQSQNVVGFYW